MIIDKLKSLTAQLYPTGRAFRMAPGSDLETLHTALAVSEAKAFADIVTIKDALLPDNANFTTDDARDWERRLGLPDGSANTLSDRKLAIARKMRRGADIRARAHYLYIEGQLQAAGFNVFVYENIFAGGTTKTPQELAGTGGVAALRHGQAQHGQRQHGGTWANKVVNSIDEARDAQFNVGANLRSTFFIGGNPIGSYAFVPASRKAEFRQLILKLKQTQLVAFLFVTYI